MVRGSIYLFRNSNHLIQKNTIEEAILGNEKAQSLIYELLAKPLFMLCLRYLKHQEDAEDVFCTGFSKLFQNLSQFEYRDRGSFEAWAKKVMVNECLMSLREKARAPMMVEPEEDQAIIEWTAIDKLSADELFNLILLLPEGYRTVFNLYEIEGYTHAEIAEKLNINIGTSKSQLNKSKTYLRKIIQKMNLNDAKKII
jgi:RNA polymerase sigma factor (sigma-70 family)